MTRTDNVKRNLAFNLIKFIVQLVLQFLIRTVLIYNMGIEYIGINGLYTNIFAFLNLAELGIGSAILFSMYKPIAENDKEKVKALVKLYKKYYLIISGVVFFIGLILTPFLQFLINGDIPTDINIYLLFLMYLVNTICTYLCAHKRSVIVANQRADLESKIKTLMLIGMSIFQVIVIVVTKNYYLFYAINIIFTIIEAFWIFRTANKLYSLNNVQDVEIDKNTKQEISKNVVGVSMHKIGCAVIFSTDNILISSLIGVIALGAYSNYSLIISALASVFVLLNSAFSGSIGNLIATSEKEKVYDKFKIVNFFYSYINSFCTICLIVLFQPFITAWTGGGEYLLGNITVILICISFYLTRSRDSVLLFRDCTGLFWKDKWKPIFEAVANLGLSILFALFMGIDGIFLGTIVSALIAPMWVEMHILFKYYFKQKKTPFIIRKVLDAVITAIIAGVCYYVCWLIPSTNLLLIIVKFIVCVVLSNVLLILSYFKTKEFKALWKIGVGILSKIFKKKSIPNGKE